MRATLPVTLLLSLTALVALAPNVAADAEPEAAAGPCQELTVGKGNIVIAKVTYGGVCSPGITPYTCNVRFILGAPTIECGSGIHVPCVGSSCDTES